MVTTTTPTIDFSKLREARGSRTILSVAQAVGISRQYLWLIEKGTRTPRGDVLAKLCWLYGLELSDISIGFNIVKRKVNL